MNSKCRSTHRASQLEIGTVKSFRMGTHIRRIHQPIINYSRLETFKKAILLLNNYRNPSNYEVQLWLFKV